MEYEKYEVIGEEKLSDIAKKYNISPEKIKEANPNARFFKTFFGTSEIVECLQTLKIPVERKIEKKQSITHSESKIFDFITSFSFFRSSSSSFSSISNAILIILLGFTPTDIK